METATAGSITTADASTLNDEIEDARGTGESNSHALFSVSYFIDLPDDILLLMFGDWLEIGALIAFDTALCNSIATSQVSKIFVNE